MYQVTVKGRNLEELKKAVSDIDNELNGGVVVSGMTKEIIRTSTNEVVSIEEAAEDCGVTLTDVVEEFTPPVVTPNPVNDVELDINNIPWDARIHAASRNKNANLSWRNKRGVDKDLLAQVEAELKANAPVVVAPVAPALPTSAPVVETPVVVETPKVEVAPTPIAAPTLNTTGGHTVASFKNNYAMVIAQLITEGKITQDYVNQLKTHFGVSEIWEITEDQKEQLFTSFVSFGFVQSV